MKNSFLLLIVLALIICNSSLAANFKSIHGIALDPEGNTIVSDMASNTIKKIDKHGEITIIAGTSKLGSHDGAAIEAEFNSPAGIACDSKGNIYVADQRNHRIRKIATNGSVSTIAGNGFQGYQDGIAAEAMFNYPEAISVAADGSILVTDKVNNLIRVIKDGQVSTLK